MAAIALHAIMVFTYFIIFAMTAFKTLGLGTLTVFANALGQGTTVLVGIALLTFRIGP